MNKEIVKAALRRLVRNFFSAFVVTFFLALYGYKDWGSINAAFLISFTNGLQSTWTVVAYPALIGALFAGVTAAGKLVRDILRENGFEDLAAKIFF